MSDVRGFERALCELAAVFEKNGVPYMIIGGLANAIWGHPRATLDIDVTIWVPDNQIVRILSVLKREYVFLVDSPFDFVLKTRVLPVKNNENQRIDIIFGALPFERDAIEDAVEVMIGEKVVKFCNAENLILMKIISERHQDLEDVCGILRYQKEQLDYNYLEPRITELSILLDRPHIKERWEKWREENA